VCVKYADQCSRRSVGAFIAERRPGPREQRRRAAGGRAVIPRPGSAPLPPRRWRGDVVPINRSPPPCCWVPPRRSARRTTGGATDLRDASRVVVTSQRGAVRRGSPACTGAPRRTPPACAVLRSPPWSSPPREPRVHPPGRRPCERRAPGSEIGLAGRPPCRQAPGVGRTAWAMVMTTARATACPHRWRPLWRRPSTTKGLRGGYTCAATRVTARAPLWALIGASRRATWRARAEHTAIALARSTAVYTMRLRFMAVRVALALRLYFAGFLGMMSS